MLAAFLKKTPQKLFNVLFSKVFSSHKSHNGRKAVRVIGQVVRYVIGHNGGELSAAANGNGEALRGKCAEACDARAAVGLLPACRATHFRAACCVQESTGVGRDKLSVRAT